MRRATLLGLLMTLMSVTASASDARWPDWQTFRKLFVSEDGRVVDRFTDAHITTSEGQAYGLFFALVAGDRQGFAQLLEWTENNLAQGDLGEHLPAWKWGRRDNGSWGVIDSNAASDADLWMAYALHEAARLWERPDYRELGRRLSRQILLRETEHLPGLGTVLLPGPIGFHLGQLRWRLNPSYLPLQLLRYFAEHDREHSQWSALLASSARVLLASAPRGFAPDWVIYDGRRGFLADPKSRAQGSFDAIRVYLWAAMLHPDEPWRDALLDHFAAMTELVERLQAPPLRIDTRDGTPTGTGPGGFVAALLPLMQDSPALPALQARLRADDPLTAGDINDNYYVAVLRLFGSGWQDGRYRFAANGELLLPDCGDCP